VCGKLGSFASGNVPGSRNNTQTWTDSQGNLWLFGGEGYDVNGTFGYLNDLWEFSPAKNEWAWMSGSSVLPAFWGAGVNGVYGSLGSAATTSGPGSRWNAAGWADQNGNLWLFGGEGLDSQGTYGYLNDLWKFDPATLEWTWMGGSNTVPGMYAGQPGVYGGQGSPGSGNIPGGRWGAASWTDNSEHFWLFGGEGSDGHGSVAPGSKIWKGQLNDLWKFDPATNQWTWISGVSLLPSDGSYAPNQYGSLGVPASGNVPGGRYSSSTWADSQGRLWLFGGTGIGAVGQSGLLNDLWVFDPSTKLWTWIAGANSIPVYESGSLPTYGVLGVPASGNVPGGRDLSSTWIDSSGNLWLFGGSGSGSNNYFGELNDLWSFNPSTTQWTWVAGSDREGQGGTFGTLGVPSEQNIPGARDAGAYWTGADGNFWLFGGIGTYQGVSLDNLNELWEYQPYANAATPTFSIAGGTYNATQTITINDTTPSATIYYTTNGMMPTTSSTKYTGAISVSSTETLKAIATADNYVASSIASATYTISPPAATPTFSLAVGTYSAAQTVTISDTSSNATIYYTTDGITTPTINSTKYTGPIIVSTNETIQAIAIASGFSSSAVASATYTISPPAATPIFSLAAGTYSAVQTVTITDTSSNATIYYTTDGITTPTINSTKYTGPIIVSTTETIQAIAIAPGFSSSAVASATYTITPNFTISGTAVTVTAGTTSGNTSIVSLTPVGGFTGSVALTAVITSGPSGGIQPTLSFGSTTPVSFTGATAGTATLTITTTASSTTQCTSENRMQQGIPWYSGGGVVLACVLLFGIPARRHSWLKMLGISLLLVALAGGAMACGGGGGGTACSPTTIAGTMPGSYTITVTGASGSITSTGIVNLTVQ
jgi:N-acetylneuraminic acid mutarotase